MSKLVSAPNSCPFPNDAIVTYSIIFDFAGESPPATTPRVGEAAPPVDLEPVLLNASPKSTAFPVDDMVIKLIILTAEGVFPM